MAGQAGRRWRAKRHVGVLITILCFAAILAAGLFYATGGRWFIIQTPSMGQYAPVGTLVFSSVYAFHRLRVGDTILFHPPTAHAETYFHRIVSLAGGVIHTKGDINGSIDPWTLHASDLIGHEAARVVGVGWLIQAIPVLLVGGLVLEVVNRYYVRSLWQFPVRVLGWSVLVAFAIFLVKPLVRAVLLTQSVVDGVQSTVLVPTGLLTLRAQAVHGTAIILLPGQPGVVKTTIGSATGRFGVLLSPHCDLVQSIILITLCLIPALLCVTHVLRSPTVEPEGVSS